jgi:hypothetical protein
VPKPKGGEPAQGSNGVCRLLPPSPHQKALQLVRVELFKVRLGRLLGLRQPFVVEARGGREPLALVLDEELADKVLGALGRDSPNS